MNIAVKQIRPWVRFAQEADDVAVPIGNTQAEMQLLSKLKSQSYKAYIGELSKLPTTDISTKLEDTKLEIKREETSLPVNILLPTQREIYLDAVIPRYKESEMDTYFKDIVELNDPIVTFNGNFVVDGHHRWLAVDILNPKAKISVINFYSDMLTPIQFLKLLQGAIVMEEGELPEVPKKYEMDVYHRSNKDIRAYIEDNIDIHILIYLKKHYKFDDSDKALEYIYQNAISLKYNNIPAIGSPSRELMPQAGEKFRVLDIIEEDAPVLQKPDDEEE